MRLLTLSGQRGWVTLSHDLGGHEKLKKESKPDIPLGIYITACTDPLCGAQMCSFQGAQLMFGTRHSALSAATARGLLRSHGAFEAS
jgi:hypothetical protein